MRHIPPGFSLSACALAASMLVAACGGGDASAPGSTSSSSGFVIDGYVSGASVLCDTNDNGSADAGERSVTTDTSGFFRFVEACAATLVATGGTNIDTGLPFVGKLKAPAGSSVITPLTTLLSAGADPSKLNEVMGLPLNTDLRATDPARKQTGSTALVNPDLFKKTLVFQQLAQKTTEVLAGLAGATSDAAKQAIYTEVVAGMATRIASSTPLNIGMTMDKAVIADLVEAAVLRVSGASALVNAETLGEVIAGALEVQGEHILIATDATLVDVTRTQQSNSQITSFVQTNRASMTAPPSPATANLATALTDQVTGTAPPPPPPPGGDTVILNFDDVLPITAAGGEGGDGSGLVAAPPAGGGSGSAYRVLRSGGQPFALAVLETALPLTSTRRTISARVYSPLAGIPMVVKLEGSSADINSGDVQANEAVVLGWQTLTWTFPASAATFTKIVLLPRLGTVDAPPGQSYFFDDFRLLAAVVAPPPPTTGTVLLNFDDVLPITAAGGEGGDGSGLVAAPPAGGGSGSAYRVLRSGGQPYALAVLETALPLTSTRRTISARVYSPLAAIPMVVKLEGANGSINSGDVQANEVVVEGWQTLTWTFPASAATYTKIVLLPRLGTVDAPPGQSYFFDDFRLLDAVVAPPPPTTGTVLLNFDDVLPITAAGGEGGDGSGLVAAPPAGGGSGSAYRVLRSGGQPYALAVLETALPLTSTRRTISARVYSPLAAIPMVVKLEGANGSINSGDVQANEVVVEGWQTLTWTFPASAATYTKIVLLPRLGTVDAPPGQSYFFDDFRLLDAAGGGGGGGASTLPITFDAVGVTYTFIPFEGASNAAVVADPAGGANMVGSVIRNAGGPWFGGVTVSTGPNQSIATIPFTGSAQTMRMRVFSPAASMLVRMKVENASDVTVTSETDAVTVGTGWEVLTFNFANPGLAPPVTGGPTAALNPAQTYNKVTLFFNVAAAGGAWGGTYYFDDIAFGTP
jgi:hypothetical protein